MARVERFPKGSPVEALISNEQTSGQRAAIESCTRAVEELPTTLGYFVVVWDGEENYTIYEPWPFEDDEALQYVKDIVAVMQGRLKDDNNSDS